MSTPKLESVKIDGLNVRFQQAGSGPPLVLVHGLLGYSFSWRFALPILAAERAVYAPDLPGSGFSDCDASLDCGVTAAARRLACFLDTVGILQCDLLGSSYGGTTALVLAAQQPGRFRTLTLVSPANPWSRIGRKRLALLRIPVIAAGFPFLARRFRSLLLSFFVRRMYGDPMAVTRETLQGYSLPLGRSGVFEHGVRVAAAWHTSMSDFERALPAASNIPTLIVWGTKDRLVDPATAERLSPKFNNVEVVRMTGAGHLPYEEFPDEFCRNVLEFLARHRPAGCSTGSNLTKGSGQCYAQMTVDAKRSQPA